MLQLLIESRPNSSQNKITLKEIKDILSKRGKTKIFEKDYRHFNAGNTDYIFVPKHFTLSLIEANPFAVKIRSKGSIAHLCLTST